MGQNSSDTRDFSASISDVAFEQLLRLAASFRPDSASAAQQETESRRKPAVRNPLAEEIELRAYHLYLERGAAHGCDLDDWLKAERQVLQDLKKDRAALRLALAFGVLREMERK